MPPALSDLAAGAASIDLSRLPAPDVVAPLDYEAIRSQLIADFRARWPGFDALVESDPAIKLLEVAAYRELLLRAAINDARTFPARYIASDKGDVLGRLDAEEFAPAARGQQLMLIAVDRASDIRQVIALRDENDRLNIALVGVREGWLVADEIAEAGIPVIVDPYANLPGSFEGLASTQQNAARLIDAGVTVALAYFADDSHQARLILQSAGNAVANGVSHEDALRAITAVPASIYGVEGGGHLQEGSPGDLVIWDGDPLEVMSAPTHVFIDGVEQSLESRQTKLRDRYLSLDESERPRAYSR